jgi:ATP-dependent Clp protease protease subunit
MEMLVMTEVPVPGAPVTPPSDVFATFVGTLDQNATQRIFQGVSAAIQGKVRHLHLLMQSTGGFAGEGVCLYNYLRSLPIDLTIYNCGSIASAAVIAYLGAKKRKVSAYAAFAVHRTQTSLQAANANRFQSIAKGLALDDQRTEAILRQHLTLSDDQWRFHDVSDLWLTAQEAVACGLADEIAEFRPAVASMVFSI